MSKFFTSLIVTAILNCIVLSQAIAQDAVVYKGGTLVDPSQDAPLENAVIIIRNGYIVGLGTDDTTPVPGDANIIDITGHWVTPGLVDAHMHFSQSGGLYTRPDAMDLRETRSYENDRAHSKAQLPDTLRRYLASGVTAIVDVGGPASNLAVRNKAGDVAPRIAIAGPLLATLTPSFAQKVAKLDLGDDPMIISAGGTEEARALVRAQLALKPDLIKIWYVVSPDRTALQSYDTVQAMVEEAHLNGLRVAVHATELETARLAIKAGADILVHAIEDKPVDEAFIASLKARDVIVVSTAVVYEHLGQLRSSEVVLSPIEKTLGDPVAIASWEETPPEIKSPAIADFINGRVETILANLKTLADAGVRVAVGTDAGNPGTLHGPSIHRELALLERAGFSAEQILRAATIDAAAVFAAEPDFGSIEIGKRADLLVLRENPHQSVAAFQSIEHVVIGGTSHNPSALAPFSAAVLVQKRLDAYNGHDIKAFAATFSKDIEIFELPEPKPSTKGRKALISQYYRLFKEAKPNCRILSRIVEGDFIIDQEFCQFEDDRPLRASVIYQIDNNLIRRVWLAKGP